MELNIRAFSEAIRRNRLLPKGVTVVLGVSGGADSVALLHLFAALRHEDEYSVRPLVAHLNHKLRGAESDADAEFVRSVCTSLEIPCHLEARDVAQERRGMYMGEAATPSAAGRASGGAGWAGMGIEEAGRRTRYDFFQRVCLRTGARFVAVAHHADDQVETVLHRIIRGTGIRGLAGMPARRPLRPGSDITLIRPLLSFDRAAILKYLQFHSLEYRDDATNRLRGPTRNRIRHDLVPLLTKEFNLQAPEAILRLAAQARLAYEHLADISRRGFEPLLISRDRERIVLDAEALGHKSPIVQMEIIRLACVELGIGERDLSFERLGEVAALIEGTIAGGRVSLPRGAEAIRVDRHLTISRDSEFDDSTTDASHEVAVLVPGGTRAPRFGIEFFCEVLEGGLTAQGARERASPNEEFVDANAVRPPLTLREPRATDRMTPLGGPTEKRIVELLRDAKIPRAKRASAGILCDGVGPIWIVGVRLAERVRITEQTRRVLRIQAIRLDRP